MVNVIEKKVWPEFFEELESCERGIEVRINDFIVNPGDTIVFREFNPVKDDYTGRKVSRVVQEVKKVDLTRFYKLEDIKDKGVLLIGLGDKK
ncbi:DUF3850 domain-containing protein [archaeon]|nr:DUF3850 domain-containing protein [archaeon]